MEKLRRDGLLWVLLGITISMVWGTWIARSGNAWIDFRSLYVGARCLMHQHNPYSAADLQREYMSEDGQRPPATPLHLQSLTLWVNLPTTFLIAAPFAALSWGPAHILWMLATGCVLSLAILLMWDVGRRHAPQLATFLAFAIAANCESVYGGGNAAGLVVGLCGIAVWCFLEDRLPWIGVVCLALSLAIKPHDSGMVWLYFLLCGGAFRKRALQSVAIAAAIGLVSIVWVAHVTPHWMQEWNANLVTISARGGINGPGPSAVTDGSVFSIVDLQAVISMFRDDPPFYNFVTYLFCGALWLLWSIRTLRTRASVPKAWHALAAAAALSLLITYHRIWDAKLVMLAIPACCLLWAEGGSLGKSAAAITSIAALLTGDVSMIIYEATFASVPMSTKGPLATAITVLFTRPATLALLALGIFYLGIYLKGAAKPSAVLSRPHAEPVGASS